MLKTDFKREIETYTAPRGEFSIVEVPALQYLSIDGHGDPNTSPSWAEAVTSIYPLAYGLRFLSKSTLGHDYVVMPLEALWWSEDLATFTRERDKSRWDWTLLMMVPDWLSQEHLDAAREAAAGKAGAPAMERVRLARYDEGLSVQTLHIGCYDDEAPVLESMHTEFIPAHSLRMTGKHHEIYLSDARRTPSHRLRTILRQPVRRIVDVPSGAGTLPI